jgi:ABC-type branched-subunit amino acid transport system substrate-binding protein
MAQAIRIGVVNDMAEAAPGPYDLEPWLRFAVDECTAAGRIDRPVEFVQAYGLGLPHGTAAALERAIEQLVEQDVLMIVGPAIGDNALVATPLADRYRVPILNWAGSERARSEYMFHLQVGSHEEDPIVVARHAHGQGAQRIGVVYDRSRIGQHHLDFFRAEADLLGMKIAATVAVGVVAAEASAEMAELVAAKPDAIVYLGIGQAGPAVARALAALPWDGLRVLNTAGIFGYAPEIGRLYDSWHYVDMYADDNRTLTAALERPGLPQAHRFHVAARTDLGRLSAEAIARASDPTRDGIKEGLERIKCLPAAEGHEGTVLSFGKYDRGALHGRYLVMRAWREGQSVQVN